MSHRAVVSLGSNIDPAPHLRRAVELLVEEVEVQTVSSVYETAPVGPVDQPRFLNAAAVLRCDLGPRRLHSEVLRPIETRLGRHRSDDPYLPRTIDLDLVLFDDLVAVFDGRRVPHPGLLEHVHVAVPVAELLPDLRHPEDGRTMSEIAENLLAGLPAGGVVRCPDLRLLVDESHLSS